MSRLDAQSAVVDVATADVIATDAAYERLLGSPTPHTVGNGTIRCHDGTVDHRVSFRVSDRAAAERLLTRRGLAVEEPVGVVGLDDTEGADAAPACDISGFDHLVFTAPHRDHALALFGASLDLEFRLDRDIGGGARQLFFRAGDLVIEVIAGVEAAPGEPAWCALWGVAWRAPDVDVTHRRLEESGLDVSEVRIGRKPGTRLFTVRDRALATRTVVIGPLADDTAPTEGSTR
ncbi:hypothetical protein AAFP35_15115 [Gordonia sp. CPCC 206044]|uniref:VOC family protein n=1 Tax=Gordonia sp. CPCC 206044 TaxID=3140793 RepID=UPI003AF360E6